MIMDNHQRSELIISENHSSAPTSVKSTSLKRSFDVAFLMMPDDRIKQRQQLEKQARLGDRQYPTDLSPRQHVETGELFNNNTEISRRYSGPQVVVRSPPRIYDDPTIIVTPDVPENPKSAFTKVNRLESPVPPPLSPDQLSCPSMSPPISTTPPRPNSGLYQNFRPEYQFNGAFQSVNQVQALAVQNQRIKQQLMYRHPVSVSPEGFVSAYPGFPFPNPAAHSFAPQGDIGGIVRSPAAAAILSTLIPPTLASTFSLTAQNVCAKCNISFRMTSDLVYHMRSHHKSEVACDPNRRKREEKLKCPVCNESFRERHHLTRHMTAHQDKESDQTATAPVTSADDFNNRRNSK
ncbi:zinc finger protein 341 [Episyrphus balteatus]|uniref:zinc finger protein 341 n=1 Tax=Episyrphus balteatus TaxID=286459 RepID=UPI00248664E7|nr:zinc finger protein 341 [Episyrphus balteatus]